MWDDETEDADGCGRVQRRERVALIATRVRAVPDDVKILKEGREFLLDDGKFREGGRIGYRSTHPHVMTN